MKKLAIILPFLLLAGCEAHYRYPCQDPENWDKPRCQKPLCDINRECPEHIFKGQRDPRQGPPPEQMNSMGMGMQPVRPNQGVNCK